MSELKKGLYEQVLSEILEKQLRALDEKLGYETGDLEREEASVELSKYMQKVTESALERIPGKKAERREKQIKICNDIIEIFQRVVEEEYEQFKISEKAQKLLSIYEKIKYQAQKKIVIPRPESPLNQSSIFTGSSNLEPSLVSE